jgi:DNA replication protein DnaC
LENHSNVILLGKPGQEKTHLASAFGHAACLQNHSVLFSMAIDVVNHLSAAQSRRIRGALKWDEGIRPPRPIYRPERKRAKVAV